MTKQEKLDRRALDLFEDLLEPDEVIDAVAQVVVGPSVWFRLLVLDLPVVSTHRRLAVTDRRVLFLAVNKYTGGMRFHHADPRDAVAVVRGRQGPFWGHLRYRAPDGRLLRLNFPPRMKRELRAVWDALTEPSDAATRVPVV